jgi:autotransporter-associated beta strand protein
MKTALSLLAAAAALFLSLTTVSAGSATWLVSPGTGDWNTAANWMPATIPNGPADIATFGISDITSILITSDNNFNDLGEVSEIRFNAGASPFTITIVEEPGEFIIIRTISGAGVVNNSGIIQNFVANSAYWGHGQFLFTNNATAGTSTVFTSNGLIVRSFDAPEAGVAFLEFSSADHATFINNPSSGPVGLARQPHRGVLGLLFPGHVFFGDNATAGYGKFTNNGGGFNIPGAYTMFIENASAGEASFINNGATAGTSQFSNSGYTSFAYSATAGNATFTNNGGLAMSAMGGRLHFADESTAGTATVTNKAGGDNAGGGSTGFLFSASADRATFVNEGCTNSNQGNSGVSFGGNSTAANSTITNNGGTGIGARGGGTGFLGHASADNATLFANGGSNGGQGAKIEFGGDSTGGTARIVLAGNGSLTISAHNAPGVTIGSFEGGGNVFLGNNNLTVGSRNNSTLFSGVIQDGGSLTKIGTGTLTLSAVNTYTGATTINAGKLEMDGSTMSAVAVNNGGTLSGSGVTRDVTVNTGGTVAPGGAQTLHINGNYAQNAGGVLKIDVIGTDPDASSRLDITGNATLNGTLEIRFQNGLLPTNGQIIKIFSLTGALSDSFAQIIFPDLRAGFQFQPEFVSGTYQIKVLNDGVPATGFLNISTRMQVGTGDSALIGGVIITGSASKKVIIRAIGPSLTSLPGRLTDPTLELRDSSGGLLFLNDNWVESTQAQQIIDTGIAPSNDHEAAIVATLAPGSYTAIMRGAGNTTGIGVVEVYDLAQDVPATLANISSRGFVQTGDNVMIGGFIAGNQATPVIVRAIGPSLTPFGIANALADPTLTLHNAQGAILAFNNDWRDTEQIAIEGTGIPPSNTKESAILATLAPGNYTGIVRGLNNVTGVGVVEVYHLQ